MSKHTDLPIRLVILDAYTMVRKGLRLLLENQPGLMVVGEAGDSNQGLKVVADQKPNIILLKLNPAGDPGLDVISRLIQTWKQARIILMTTTEDRQVCQQAIQEGVLGVVSYLQSPEVLVKAIEKVNAGEVWIEHSMVARILTTDKAHRSFAVNSEEHSYQELSKREREVIQLIGRGLKNQQIANQLCISESTVGHHLTSIYTKLGVSDRLELLIFAHQKGLVQALK